MLPYPTAPSYSLSGSLSGKSRKKSVYPSGVNSKFAIWISPSKNANAFAGINMDEFSEDDEEGCAMR